MASIYSLTDPRTDEIRYIGQTAQPLVVRLAEHLRRCWIRKHHCANWIRSLLKNDLRPQILLLEECSVEELDVKEIYWIAYGKEQGWKLTNSTEGGRGNRGWIPSPETRARWSEIRKGNKHWAGRKHSEESKQKQSDAKKGNQYFLGHTQTEETKQKHSEAMKGKLIGEKNPKAKLTEADVIEIRRLLNSDASHREIAKQFGVSKNTISKINTRSVWGWLKGDS